MAFTLNVPPEAMERASRVALKARLLDVRAFEISGKILDVQAAAELQDVEEFSSRVGVDVSDDVVAYHFHVDFTVKGLEDRPAIQVSLHIAALFDVPQGDPSGSESSEAFQEEDLAAFGASTVQMIVFPYIRSVVSDLTVRLGCSPVTLDLLILQDSKEEKVDSDG